MVENQFPDLERLATKFFRKNNSIPVFLEGIETHEGFILHLGGDNLVLLSVYNPNPMGGNQLAPYIGGDGSHMYSSEEQTYKLSGRLENRQVHLETVINRTQDYKMEKRGEPYGFCSQIPVKNGEPKITIERKDDFPYWFITKPN